jgi:hypothetical protein
VVSTGMQDDQPTEALSARPPRHKTRGAADGRDRQAQGGRLRQRALHSNGVGRPLLTAWDRPYSYSQRWDRPAHAHIRSRDPSDGASLGTMVASHETAVNGGEGG